MQGAVVYLRVSTKEQATNQSLNAQRKACTEYCHQHDLELVEVFRDEGESAKTAHRREFRKLLDFCKTNRGRVQYLVVQDLSRFSRDTHDHEVIRAMLLGFGVRLRSCREPIDESASGKFTEHIMAAVAQLENDLKSERTIERMKAAASHGRYMWKSPVGYRNGDETTSLVEDSKGSLVRQAFELFATGRFSKREVLDKMLALGLTSRNGRPLTPQSFGNLLKNPAYCGRLVSKTWGLSGRGDWHPLVSEETFDQVQVLLTGKRGGSAGRRKRDHEDFPLRRIVKCEECKKPVTGSWSRGKAGKRYAYYRCRDRDCSSFNVSKDTMEAAFLKLLESLRPKVVYWALFREIVRDVWKQRRVEAGTLRRTLEKRVVSAYERIDQLVEAHVHAKSIDRQTYETRMTRERERLALAQLELHDAELDELDVEGLLAFAERLLTNAARLWPSLDLGRKIRLQSAVFPTGLEFDGDSFRTLELTSVFSYLRAVENQRERMASPTGFEPVSQP